MLDEKLMSTPEYDHIKEEGVQQYRSFAFPRIMRNLVKDGLWVSKWSQEVWISLHEQRTGFCSLRYYTEINDGFESHSRLVPDQIMKDILTEVNRLSNCHYDQISDQLFMDKDRSEPVLWQKSEALYYSWFKDEAVRCFKDVKFDQIMKSLLCGGTWGGGQTTISIDSKHRSYIIGIGDGQLENVEPWVVKDVLKELSKLAGCKYDDAIDRLLSTSRINRHNQEEIDSIYLVSKGDKDHGRVWSI